MNLEEAKEILLNVIADEVIGTYCIEIQKETDCSKNCENEDCFLQQAISTVLQEIETLQKSNAELQKEKAEYEASWNNTAHELRIFRNECVPKSEIREKIEEITDKYNRIYKFPSRKVEETPEGKLIYSIRFNTDSEALRIAKVILKDLLKEE